MGIENVDYSVASRWNEATRTKEKEERLRKRNPFDTSVCLDKTEEAIEAVSKLYEEYPLKHLYDARMSLDSALRSLNELPEPLKDLDNV